MADGCSTRVRRVLGSPAERLGVFAEVAVRGARSPVILALADVLRAGRSSDREVARAIQLRAQELPYVPDRPGAADDVRDPCRVLEVGGDCEDLAILVAALDLAAGLTPRLCWLPQPEAEADHVSVAVLVDGDWLWQEPTVRAELGEHPFRAAARVGGVTL